MCKEEIRVDEATQVKGVRYIEGSDITYYCVKCWCIKMDKEKKDGKEHLYSRVLG
jgi:hypothetical protein